MGIMLSGASPGGLSDLLLKRHRPHCLRERTTEANLWLSSFIIKLIMRTHFNLCAFSLQPSIARHFNVIDGLVCFKWYRNLKLSDRG
jgi:hypothetical protein